MITPQPDSTRPTVITVSLDAIASNLELVRAQSGDARIMGVVKANAYGHGMVPVARHLLDCGVDSLAVALVEEGITLREAGVAAPILVFYGFDPLQIELFLDHNLDVTVTSSDALAVVNEAARARGTRARIQLKIDTGMARVGDHYENAETLFTHTLDAKHCELCGIYSHFATANGEDLDFAREQLRRFNRIREIFQAKNASPPLFHISCSGAIFQLPESSMDMVRPGISLYGVYPDPYLKNVVTLTPAMSLRSAVLFTKDVRKGVGVSYDHTWYAPHDTRIASIPIGYGDGYPWRLSNQGTVLIREKRYPVVGKVCMDMIMVDIGEDRIAVGDSVILVGSSGAESIHVNEIAELVSSSPYEILTGMMPRVPRVYESASHSF